jgi:hypothetical protein
MTKIKQDRPKGWQGPVQISDTQYEIWFLRPVLLDTIEKKSGKWHTGDGMRFLSSYDATDYLVEKYISEATDSRGKSPAPTSTPTHESPPPVSARRRVTTGSGGKSNGGSGATVDRELYEEFLRFKEFQRRVVKQPGPQPVKKPIRRKYVSGARK